MKESFFLTLIILIACIAVVSGWIFHSNNETYENNEEVIAELQEKVSDLEQDYMALSEMYIKTHEILAEIEYAVTHQ